MIFETLPGIYAQALLDLTEKDFEAVAAEFGELVTMMQAEGRLQSFFDSPLIKAENKVQVLEKSLRGKASTTLVNFLCVMAQRNRLAELNKVYEVYRYLVDNKLGKRSVTVVTAFALDDATRGIIEKSLEKYFASKLHVYYEVDASLIGGIVVRSEGREIDVSILKKIRSIRMQMTTKKIFGENYYEN
ncbi:ATP synthase F1 subunit delta [Leptonema illini]|jgi:F-type H+-transporting ATPase subunit delta|uniref:ATP synthase subunit delta n=1 Tax=Leptonema illini DSM 21528 TaxID=929563 RepID=H2CK35_9LEPT|nr:ATP synthase F1 subunit delta [Leptonema illini]EHQ06124.1 ATP synthase F1 subcomplex delta subunit [Leptonema illini DSM 21528]PKL33156.1 MAG: ATP synthase F1 subunit delta [Spirochaetae bacterium HGW-Spirochaetae-10]